jgi:hypothetical protein
MNAQRINEICETNRQTGSTNWILFGAVTLPDCIIVAHDMKYSLNLRTKYDEILRRLDINPRDPAREYPVFTHVGSTIFRGGGYRNKPIIFDNSCFF